MKDFTGKIAFITGGASGAGLGQAKVFSEAGCKVVIADIRQDHLDEAMACLKNTNVAVHAIKLDITDRKAYAAAADEVEEVFGGPPQLLFNTAGVNLLGPAEASTFEDYDWLIGVDLFGVINGMVTFVPRMIKAGKGGHIATTSSMSGFIAGANCAPYAAAKAGVNSLMESYYQALKPYGIGVTCLCPGSIQSNIAESIYTRPEHLSNTGYHIDAEIINSMAEFYAGGIDPVELAHILKKAIEEEQLFVIPFSNSEEMLRNNFERIIDYSSPEGTRKREIILQKRVEENKANGVTDTGWSKPREGITWVKENPYAQIHD